MSNASLSPRSHLNPDHRHHHDKAFVFCHGFAFDKHYWDKLSDYFKGYECYYWDLGYFSKNEHPLPSNHHLKVIGVGHSLGFRKLLKRQDEFDALIGLQSFLNFGNNQKIRAKQIAGFKKVREDFRDNPKNTIMNFYESCQVDYLQSKVEDMSWQVLEQDLDQLEKELDPPKCPTLIIGSKQDEIVPPELIKDNFEHYKNVKTIIQDIGSHNLGYAEPKFVFDTIISFVKDI